MRIRNLVSLFVATLFVVATVGCAASGHRKTTFKFLGNELSFEDQVYPNDKGVNEYSSGFDPENIGLMKWVLGKETLNEKMICSFEHIQDCGSTPVAGSEFLCWQLVCHPANGDGLIVNPTASQPTESGP